MAGPHIPGRVEGHPPRGSQGQHQDEWTTAADTLGNSVSQHFKSGHVYEAKWHLADEQLLSEAQLGSPTEVIQSLESHLPSTHSASLCIFPPGLRGAHRKGMWGISVPSTQFFCEPKTAELVACPLLVTHRWCPIPSSPTLTSQKHGSPLSQCIPNVVGHLSPP